MCDWGPWGGAAFSILACSTDIRIVDFVCVCLCSCLCVCFLAPQMEHCVSGMFSCVKETLHLTSDSCPAHGDRAAPTRWCSCCKLTSNQKSTRDGVS